MTYDELATHVAKQVENMLCYTIDVSDCIEEAVYRTDVCLKNTKSKYYSASSENEVSFSVYNSVQYCIFLYFLSNIIYKKNGDKEAEKIYYLNKILHSIDLFYKIELPSIWSAEHPLATVMGRAKYSDYFFFYQGCTVGGNLNIDGISYPTIGNKVIMYSNSKILGDSVIGDNVVLAANAYVINERIPSNCIVFGQSPNLSIKAKTEEEMDLIIKHFWK